MQYVLLYLNVNLSLMQTCFVFKGSSRIYQVITYTFFPAKIWSCSWTDQSIDKEKKRLNAISFSKEWSLHE